MRGCWLLTFAAIFVFTAIHPASTDAIGSKFLKLTPENAASLQKIATIKATELPDIHHIHISLDGSTIALTTFDDAHFAEIWTLYPSPELLNIIRVDPDTLPIWQVRLSSTGKFALVNQLDESYTNNDFTVFDSKTGKTIKNLGMISDVTFNTNDTLIAYSTASVSTPEQNATTIWDLAAQKEVKRFDYPFVGPRGLFFSPDGQRLAIIRDDGLISIVGIAPENTFIRSIAHHPESYISRFQFISNEVIAYSMDTPSLSRIVAMRNIVDFTTLHIEQIPGLIDMNSRIITVFIPKDTPTYLFLDLFTREVLSEISLGGLQLNFDGSLAMDANDPVSVYAISTGEKLIEIAQCAAHCVAQFNPDGKTILIKNGKSIEIWGVTGS